MEEGDLEALRHRTQVRAPLQGAGFRGVWVSDPCFSGPSIQISPNQVSASYLCFHPHMTEEIFWSRELISFAGLLLL